MREEADPDVVRQVREAIARASSMRVGVRQTIYALKHHRRTPAQIHDLCERCERLRRRARLLRLSHSHLRSIH